MFRWTDEDEEAVEVEEDEEFGPGDPDYDLSEEYGYSWEPQREHWPISPAVLIVVSIVLAIALILPALIIIARAG